MFPRLVYKSASKYCLAVSQAEFDRLINDGWFATVPEALDGERRYNDDDVRAPTREELKEKARELGLKFDGRISDEKLMAMIEVALDK